MRRLSMVLMAVGVLGAPAPASRPASRFEPLQFFGEDWDARGRTFASARAARDAFVARLDGVQVEDFERARGRVLELPLGGYDGTLVGGVKDSVSAVLRLSPGRRPTSGRRFYEHGSDALSLDFAEPVEAVGFYGIDVGDAGGRLRVTLSGDDGWEASFPVPHHVVARGAGQGEGAVLFFGVIAPGARIRHVELRNVGDPGDGFGYDDLTVGRMRKPVV